MKLVRYLKGDYAGRCLVEDDDIAAELAAEGIVEYANRELEYLTREMTADAPKRGRPRKKPPAEAEPSADED